VLSSSSDDSVSLAPACLLLCRLLSCQHAPTELSAAWLRVPFGVGFGARASEDSRDIHSTSASMTSWSFPRGFFALYLSVLDASGLAWERDLLATGFLAGREVDFNAF
jgi:hypothetical protein